MSSSTVWLRTNDRLRKVAAAGGRTEPGRSRRDRAPSCSTATGDAELAHLLSFFYDTVASAELGDEEFTFDLSVPDNVTYVANGFVSHNTIGLMMDCDTTGIEPDLALTKAKKLVGGGTMFIVNQTIPRALRKLGYADGPDRRDRRLHRRAQDDHGRAGVQPRAPAGVRVLDGRQHDPLHGPRPDDGCGAAVHLGRDLEDREYARGRDGRGRRGAATSSRGGSGSRPWRSTATTARWRSRSSTQKKAGAADDVAKEVERIVETVIVQEPVRQKLPKVRNSKTFSFRVADCHGYVTVGEYEDGRPGEVFLKVAKQGSTLAGIMDAFAISVSHGLQYGVPLEAFVEMFTNMRFEPAGMTDDPDIRFATSLIDYIFRRFAVEYLPIEKREAMGIMTVGERLQPTLPGVEEATTPSATALDLPPEDRAPSHALESPQPAPPEKPAVQAAQREVVLCHVCGDMMQRAGSCYACPSCGSTSGCS